MSQGNNVCQEKKSQEKSSLGKNVIRKKSHQEKQSLGKKILGKKITGKYVNRKKRLIIVTNASLIGLAQSCNTSQVSYMSFRTLLFNLGGPILYGLFGSLEHAKLTAIKSASGHDTIQSTPLCQNNFGPQKSNLSTIFVKSPFII